MTLKDIRSMFAAGQKWSATRTGLSLAVNGNAGSTVLPPNNVTNETREVLKVGSADLVWGREGHSSPLFTKWPKASEIIEARDGFLSFKYDNGVVVSLSRL